MILTIVSLGVPHEKYCDLWISALSSWDSGSLTNSIQDFMWQDYVVGFHQVCQSVLTYVAFSMMHKHAPHSQRSFHLEAKGDPLPAPFQAIVTYMVGSLQKNRVSTKWKDLTAVTCEPGVSCHVLFVKLCDVISQSSLMPGTTRFKQRLPTRIRSLNFLGLPTDCTHTASQLLLTSQVRLFQFQLTLSQDKQFQTADNRCGGLYAARL